MNRAVERQPDRMETTIGKHRDQQCPDPILLGNISMLTKIGFFSLLAGVWQSSIQTTRTDSVRGDWPI
ncbi:hypothetical protein [Chamaesiphon sp. OTE_75_metabat_556]|uniref:hypothetical protein n=1 Tax=Chamaesiphon sp. OTE_75_metabat_556 TaxID=2964692 RepID=UPI00286C07F4|nr:hypothetical protein [Chamaesiphon sp. OTE_75_metabat_556]